MESIRLYRGVTLVELVVVLGIIGVLSVVMVTSHTTFNKSILLTNVAYDVALTIRSAETFGLGSRVTSGLTANTGYGVHFTPNSNSFVLFGDTEYPNASNCHGLRSGSNGSEPDAIPGNCVYNSPASGGTDLNVTTYTLGNGMKVAPNGVCVYPIDNGWECSASGSLDIVFARPNTRTFFSYNGAYRSELTKARVILISPQGGTSNVCVALSGEIHVSATDCL